MADRTHIERLTKELVDKGNLSETRITEAEIAKAMLPLLRSQMPAAEARQVALASVLRQKGVRLRRPPGARSLTSEIALGLEPPYEFWFDLTDCAWVVRQ